MAETLFNKATKTVQNAIIQRNTSSTTLYLGPSIAQVNHVVRVLMGLLEDVTLDPTARGQEALTTRPLQRDYFMEIAKLIKLSHDNNLQLPLNRNWRYVFGFDDVDDLIVLGCSPLAASSKNAKETYREHVVPVSLIKREAEKLAQLGAPEQIIADFIQHHLYVVIITKEEAALLDRAVDNGGLSLKTSMPEGWVLGDDPLARLQVAGIRINYTNPIPLPEWKPWRKPRPRDKIRRILNTQVIKV